MKRKQLWLLVGGNGAGKSTFYEQRLKPLGLPFVNADIIARALYPDAPEVNSLKAARIAEELRYKLVRDGESFCFETVFSHSSKIDFVAHAKALGYEIVLVFIHLESVALNQARVYQRVRAGGHFVPDIKVANRIPRTLRHVLAVLPLCDQVRVLDNSSLDNPFAPVLTVDNRTAASNSSHITRHRDPLPHWAATLISD